MKQLKQSFFVTMLMSMVGTISYAKNISFADANVKAICVANWDTNGDGELSEAEAATVTSLGEVFKSNTDITSFNELQYFTGQTSISDEAFQNCSSMGSVIIPNGVTTIAEYAFSGCTSLSSLIIPNTVNRIKDAAYMVVFCICAVAYLIGWCIMKALVPKYKPIELED